MRGLAAHTPQKKGIAHSLKLFVFAFSSTAGLHQPHPICHKHCSFSGRRSSGIEAATCLWLCVMQRCCTIPGLQTPESCAS